MISIPSFEDTAAAHGHSCPGLAIGYRMSKAAVSWAGDEENISVYSTTTKCPLDAIRFVFHLREHPERLSIEDRHELRFILRKPDGSRLFIDEVPGSKISSSEGDALREKIRCGTASPEETARFEEIRKELVRAVFETPDEKLFSLRMS